MTDLYSRILLWHKLLAMQTGGLALCSARHKLNRDEARAWAASARNVADDIDAFLETGTFILDSKGVRLVRSLGEDEVMLSPGPQEVCREMKPQATGCKAGGLRVATRKIKIP